MKRPLKLKKLKGYTLIEVIIYLALFGFIFTSVISFFLVINEFNKHDKYQVDVEKAEIFVIQHLEESFKNSKTISSTASHFDVDIGDLTLTKNDNSTIRYYVANNRIKVSTSTEEFISQVDLVINKLKFQKIINNGVLVGVRFEISITSVKAPTINKDVIYSYVLQ